jgi:hypothetical protein
MVGANVGGVSENPDGFPEHGREKVLSARSSAVVRQKETENPPLVAQIPKILNPFTCALAPPFIGRRRDFYIPKTPWNSKNIPNVNPYKNVFSSHTFTSLSLVHTLNPDFLGRQL